jgi:molybdopterin molybdotransferase
MPVVSFEEALQIVAHHAAVAPGLQTESLPLLQCASRVLAVPVAADRDQPPFDRSTRDGFAVRALDAVPGAPLRVLGQVAAGALWQGQPIATGEAVQIMTGAPVPAGADAVVMIEHVERGGSAESATIVLQTGRKLSPGENIVPRGKEAREGACLLSPGTRIGSAEIALAAASGASSLEVFARAGVAIVATGDELVELDRKPGPQQIRNSNSYALAAMVQQGGGSPQRLPTAADRREVIRERILEGRKSNLLLLSGGVSMGEYDLVEEVLASFDAEFFFTGVLMQPGKPVVFGRLPAGAHGDACFFFGLPGNPISTQVTFHCFVEPFLRALGGEPSPSPRFVQATLANSIEAGPRVTRLLPAHQQGVTVTVVGWQGSGDLAANARANCYAELLPGRDYQAGEIVRILLR